MLTFRDALLALCPSWLRNGVTGKVLYAIGVHLDVLVLFAQAALKSRFPGLYSPESLPIIGRERRIRRGPNESAETYALRLRRWLDDHATRGGPYALLAQLRSYYATAPFPIRLVYRSGRAFDMDVNGVVTMSDVQWSPSVPREHWGHWWLIYQWPSAIGPTRTIGETGLRLGDDWVLGSGLTHTALRDLQSIPQEWNAAHSIGHIVLLHDGGWVLGFPPHALGSSGLRIGIGVGPIRVGVPS